MSFNKVFYCTRCGHREDCHIAENATKGSCTGRTKKSRRCQCPGYARGRGMNRRVQEAVRSGKVVR